MVEYISDLLARYKHITPPNESVKKLIANTIKDTIKIDIPHTHIHIQNETAYISHVSAAVRSELRLHREKLCTAADRTTNGVITTIR